MANLRGRIRGGESARIEFKEKSPGPLKLARVIASFANSAGGELFIGINDLGRIVGLDDKKATRRDVDEALELIDPWPDIKTEDLVHDLKDVLTVTVDPIEYPDFCHVVQGKDRTAYFRIQKESRSITREVEKTMIRLRRHAKGNRKINDDAARLVAWLWEKGEAPEATCARKLNYSSHRLRKLAESLIGAGYLLPCRMGEGRTYVAINPAPKT